MMESSNLDSLSSIHSPSTSIWALIPLFSIFLPQIFFIKPQFSIVNQSSSILTQKYGIFDSKFPQNSVISYKMSASPLSPLAAFSMSAKNHVMEVSFYFLYKSGIYTDSECSPLILHWGGIKRWDIHKSDII